ncbi:hypothetical protein BJV82DRAFT_598096 [Fennellomyces sp. T-0311]|nr:hypothetical protein BJV82DRAFT_598096 [Fennellomyces sp. T-0311]
MGHQKAYVSEDERAPLLFGRQQSRATIKREAIGLILIAGYALFMCTASVFVKIGGNIFPSSQIVFARSVIQTGLGFVGCFSIGIHPLGHRDVRKWVLLRGLMGAIALIFGYYGLMYLPLGDATVIVNLQTIFATILAAIVLKEPFGRFERLCLVVCMTGTILVAKPTFLFGSPQNDGNQNGNGLDDIAEHTRLLAVLARIGCALLSAVAYVTIRKVGPRAHFLNYTLAFGAIAAVVSGLKFHDFRMPEEVSQYIVLALVGIFAFLGQCCINLGLQMAPTGPGTLMCMNENVFAFLYGVFIFHEYPDLFSILGAIMIIGVSAMLGLRKK